MPPAKASTGPVPSASDASMSTASPRGPVARQSVLLAVVALLLVVTAAWASPARAASKAVQAQYSGKLTITFKSPPLGGSPASRTYSYDLSWREHATASTTAPAKWTIDSLSGSIADRGTFDDGSPFGCTATLSNNGEQPSVGSISATGKQYVVSPPFGVPTAFAHPTVTSQSAGDVACSNPTVNYLTFESDQSIQAAWSTVSSPDVTFPANGTYVQPLDFSWSCPDAGCPGTESLTQGSTVTYAGTITQDLKSSLVFAGPGFGTGSPKLNPKGGGGGSGPPALSPRSPAYPEKLAAQKDLRKALEQAKPPCIRLAAATLATVWAGTVGVGSVAVGITAGTLYAGSLPECTDLIRRAYDDAKIVNDPPDPHVYRLARPATGGPPARLPSCNGSADKPYCRSLRSRFASFLADVHRVRTVDDALLATVDRITAAARAHNRHALTIQQAHAKQLSRRFRAALAAQRAAGDRLERLISSAHVSGHLDQALASQAVTTVLGRLGRLHVSRAELTQLGAGPALAIGPIDILKTLEQ
jgi:hypothetical protein